MSNKPRKAKQSRYTSTPKAGSVQLGPRVRPDQSNDYEDYRIVNSDHDTYSRVAGASYLGSEAIKTARKRRKRRKVLTGVLCVLLAVLLVGGGFAIAYLAKISGNLSQGIDKSLLSVLTPTDTPEDPFYILLLGVDKSEERIGDYGENYRSDSMILARIDPKNKKATLVSIPRDTKVDLGQYGTNKINAAHFFGGPALAVKAVSELAGVPIAHYAEIDLDGFGSLVDAVGGVEVDVPIEINDDLAGGHVAQGKQTLNGEQALILCRSRHAYDQYGSGDMYRAANQRMVLSAIAKKLLSSDALTIASTLEKLSKTISTDMSIDSIVSTALAMKGMDTETDIYTASCPVTSEYQDGVWYDIVNKDEWKQMMKRVDAGLSPTESSKVDEQTGTVMSNAGSGATSSSGYSINSSQTIRLRNGKGTAGICEDAKSKLASMGYKNFDLGNANNFNYPETIIVYKNANDQKYAQQMAEVLGVGKPVLDNGEYLFESDFLIVLGADWPI